MSKLIAQNKKARFNYEIIDTFEAGISLLGSEVKALRAARVNIKDSFIKIVKNEAFIFNMHISHLKTTNMHFQPDALRDRKLLLHKKEIKKLLAKVMQEGLSIVPLNIYFNHKNMVKLKIALGKGKKLHDKRESLKKKAADKKAKLAMKQALRK